MSHCVKLYLLYCFQLCFIFALTCTCHSIHFTAILQIAVLLQQTVPDNSLVCPGQPLVCTCTTVSTGSLEWQTSGEEPVLFHIIDSVNIPKPQNQFVFQLTSVNLTDLMMISTATSEMANSDLDGLLIKCRDGLNSSSLYVDVAGMGVHVFTY